jgi:hypothetical protein
VPDNQPDSYAVAAVSEARLKGILTGDKSGNERLHDTLTRQDALVLMKKAGLF